MRFINRLVEAAITLLFALMLVVGTLQVANRFFFNISLSWSEELQIYTFIWLVFLAIPATYNRYAHLRVDSLVALFPPAMRHGLDFLTELLWLGLGITMSLFTWKIMQVTQFQHSPGLGIPMSWAYAGVLVGNLYLILCVASRLITGKRSTGETS